MPSLTSRRGFLALTSCLALARGARAAPTPVSVTDDGLIAMFYPAASRPGRRKAAVLMLGGSGGGYPYADAAADLAAAGHPTLALAYFSDRMGQPKGLPTALSEIPLEYMFKAIDWLRKAAGGAPVALMGESRGGELVLLVGSHRPDVAGVIAYSPSEAVWAALAPGAPKTSWTLEGKPLPFLIPQYEPGDMRGMFDRALAAPAPTLDSAMIPVERIKGPILLVSSRADRLWPSAPMADAVEVRLKRLHFRGKVENRQYDDASHLLMGFGPAPTDVTYGTFTMHFGGSAAGTLAARNDAWAHSKAWLATI
jgi:dienelactone hydrolase